MDVYALNPQFEIVDVIDIYESFIWTDRYNKPGDFELYTTLNDVNKNNELIGNYFQIKESEHTMIVEDVEITTDVEAGAHIKVTGRSLESILDRRIVWEQTNISGSLQNGIKKLITDAIINPSIADRKISNFVFKDSTDTAITSLTVDAQYTGDNLLTIIQDLCSTFNIGFKIVLNKNNKFVFSLYAGTDRSYRQDPNPYVVFRPSFENLVNSNFTEKHSEEKNITLVAGEGQNQERITRTVGSGSGLARKELYTDARDIQKEEGMTDETYNAKLDQRGTEKLNESKAIKTFDGECETTKMFVYQKDFFMGDCVQVANEYGKEAPTRVMEYIWCSDINGITSYPTFESLEYES